MKNKTKISVGIPVYNEETNIENLLKAILSQKGKKFKLIEIIVISDGSTDKTIENINKVKNKLIRLIAGDKRLGQSRRQNQIIESMSKQSDCLLLFEADTLPVGEYFIKELVSSIPKNGKFSMIIGRTVPDKATNFFSKIMNFGVNFRYLIHEKATSPINVYTCADSGLLSREFLKTFRWDSRFNEDSYCFREAINSGLPVIRNKNAFKLQHSVENLHDWLLQSGKFIKASKVERNTSRIYTLRYNYWIVLLIALKSFFKNPILFTLYLIVSVISRINSIFLPGFSPKWEIYISSKKLIIKNAPR